MFAAAMSLTSVGGAPSSSVVAPPWLRDGRSRRSGALRRAQYHRAEARVIGKLLQHFAALQHRGCCATKLGDALVHALTPAAAAAAPLRPPGIFYGQDAAATATTAYAQPVDEATYAAPASTANAPLASEAPATTAYVAPARAEPRTTSRTDRAKQPSIVVELINIFEGEILKCGTSPKPCTHYGLQRCAKARFAFESMELADSLAVCKPTNLALPASLVT